MAIKPLSDKVLIKPTNAPETTKGGIIMLSLDGGCVGCSSTPMTAMQIYYSLMKLDPIEDVIFVNGELPEYMRTFINQKMASESEEPVAEII